MRPRRQPLCHREPVDARELDVQQHDLRPEPLGLGDGLGSVPGLAHHGVAVGLQQRSRGVTELLVVINDQNRHAHLSIIAGPLTSRIVAGSHSRRKDPNDAGVETVDPGALKARYRRWLLQEWGEGNPAVAGELIAEGLVDHNRPQGPAGRLAGDAWMAKMIRTAFPGATFQAEAKRPAARQPCAMRSAGCLGHRSRRVDDDDPDARPR